MRRITAFLSIVLASFLFLFTFIVFFHPVTAITQDLGRHLKVGEIIWQTGQIRRTNLFSYTQPDHPFLNHHWGSEVVLYLIQTIAGWNGLIILKLVVVFTSLGITFFSTAKRTSLWVALVVGALYAPLLLERTDERPEIFGYLFVSLFLLLLHWAGEGQEGVEGNRRKRWMIVTLWLVFIEILWVNLHISFVFGVLIAGLFFTSHLIDALFQKRRTTLGTFFILFSGVVLATLVNPHTLTGALAPFAIFQNYGYSIVENQNIFFLGKMTNNPVIGYFFVAVVLLAIGMIGCLGSLGRLRNLRSVWFDLFVGVTFTILAFLAIRNMPFFVLTTFPVASIGIQRLWQDIQGKKENRTKIARYLPLVILMVSIVWVGWFLKDIGSGDYYKRYGIDKRLGWGSVEGARGAVDFILNNAIKGPIFNNFDIGSYLLFRLYPSEKVFVDGRPEAYSLEFFQKIYIPMQLETSIWEKMVERYEIRTIIFGHADMTDWGRAFLTRIVRDNRWETVYLDNTAIVLVYKQFQNPETSHFQPIDVLSSHTPIAGVRLERSEIAYRRLANFFIIVGNVPAASWYLDQSRFF